MLWNEVEKSPIRARDVESSASLLRENLLRKDLIFSPRRGLVAFTVPLFAAYAREQHPLASFEDE